MANIWYVSPLGNNTTGNSWTNAWTSEAGITGTGPNDIVYFDGNTSGSSYTYNRSTYWVPAGGSTGLPVTYKTSSDIGRNGMVKWNLTGTGTSWVTGTSNVVMSGDIGDGNRHMELIGNYGTVSDNSTNIRISYIKVDTLTALGQAFTITTQGWEIDHCLIKSTDLTNGQSVFQMGMAGTAYDQSIIHHNTILSPYNPANGFGVDVFSSGNGVSVYNNTLQGYSSAYSSGQHQDGWQINGGDYIRFYNNTVIDITNYAFFGEAYYSGFNHVQCYNNLCLRQVLTGGGGGGGGIIIGINNSYVGTTPCIMNDIIVANNTVVDYMTPVSATAGVSCNNDFGVSATFTATYVVNNLIVNGATSIDTTGNTGGTYSGNVFISSATAASYFTSYTVNSASNNYNLTASATLAIGTGLDMSSFFTTDFAGTSRSAPWDSGAYKSGGGATLFGGRSLSGKLTRSGKLS